MLKNTLKGRKALTRKIIHIDMDAFYASIEQRDNPDLKGRPVVVGGSPEGRGVVAAASYEARKFGIHSAMPAKRALALCRDLVFIRPDFEKYKGVSKRLYHIYREYTDLVEPVSLDECYLDVTENKKGIPTATETALEIKGRIKSGLNLTASAGVAPNKLIAKIASDIKKPDGITIIKPRQVDDFVKTLEVKKIWGVGKVTQTRLAEMGVTTCGDLQRYTREELMNAFGKFGYTLYDFARGIDGREVDTSRDVKSVGSEKTFAEDVLAIDDVKIALRREVERVCKRLSARGLKGRTITIKIKYADFRQITRSRTIGHVTGDLEEIYGIAAGLLDKTEAGVRKIRLVGASVGGFDGTVEGEGLLFG